MIANALLALPHWGLILTAAVILGGILLLWLLAALAAPTLQVHDPDDPSPERRTWLAQHGQEPEGKPPSLWDDPNWPRYIP